MQNPSFARLIRSLRPTPTVRGCGSAFAGDAERGARPLGKKNRGLLPAACGTAVASPPTPPAAVGSRVNLEGDEGFRWTTASRRRAQPLAGIKIPPALQHSRRRPRVVVPKSVRQLLPGGALPPHPQNRSFSAPTPPRRYASMLPKIAPPQKNVIFSPFICCNFHVQYLRLGFVTNVAPTIEACEEYA